jgi:F-type H+-transporting ATPase subunit gamma
MASAELRIINRRIKSVKSTKKITRAMELIASSRIVKAQQRMDSSNSYIEVLDSIVKDLVGTGGFEDKNANVNSNKTSLIVITSDRGLAGGYNSNVLKLADKKYKELISFNKDIRLITIGKKGSGYFKYRNLEPESLYEGITDEPKFENAFEVMKSLINSYISNELSEAYIIYTKYVSALNQKAIVKQLLPIEKEDRNEAKESTSNMGGYLFEPSVEEVLEDLIPKYMNATLFGALLNSSTSEHASRMRAMKAATENAEDLVKVLTRKSNQARQAEITTEISEIVGGAEALAE